MKYLPLHFDLDGRRVLVVGGGEVAARKLELLLAAGALIRLVAPDIQPVAASQLKDQLEEKRHELLAAPFNETHLQGCVLAVAASSDQQVNRQVSECCQQLAIPVNVVDAPELCTVIFPAIVNRDPLLISVGTSGGSPVLARTIRQQIEALLPASLGRLGAYLAERRDRLKAAFADVGHRRKQTEAFLASPGADLAMQGKSTEADNWLFENYLLEKKEAQTGEVYLVGAGPGDPDLLTLKALQLMQKADVILYDNLVSTAVLERARRDAAREFVGKRSGYKSTSQEDINDLLVRLAKEGKRVLRLKGGDPFIFGRGGEEIIRLVAEEIPFQVVPGITAATGCAAYAGIPLTHRDLSQCVRFVTGHPKDGKVDLPWRDYANANETVVFYMGLGGLASICRQLVQHGRDASTPVAIVSRGTTPEQQVLRGTLETITGLAVRTHIQTPTVIIVGEVVNFGQP